MPTLPTSAPKCVLIAALLLAVLSGMSSVPKAMAQDAGTVSGTVTSAPDGEPIPGVNVLAQGTEAGTATDANGAYSLEVPSEADSLVFSFVGYDTRTVAIAGRSTIDVTLEPSTAELDEVVVVGYGTQERQELTGAVSRVTAQQLEGVQATSPAEALQGMTAGVQVTSGGAPGTDATVRIRGLNTVNNNNPLYVVDGVPVGGINSIDPSNISSVEVLKGPSAAAIYGSRASGGVVLITTKGGSPGELQVDVNSSYGVRSVPQRLDLLNTTQYIDYTTAMQENAGLDPPGRFSQPEFQEELESGNINTDWQDAVFQQGILTINDLSVSGGNEDATYRTSLGYANEQGTIVETGFERYSLRVNSAFDLGRFSLSENLALSYQSEDNLRGTILGLAQRMPPYLDVYDPDNPGGYDGLDLIDLADDQNPVRLQELGYDRTNEMRVVGNITGQMQIFEGLNLRSVLGAEIARTTGEVYLPSFRTGEYQGQDFANITENRFTYFSPISTTTLNLDQSIDNHAISSTLGFEVQNDLYRSVTGTGRNPLTNEVRTIGSVQNDDVGGVEEKDVLVSFFGRVNYNYDQRYLLEAALRRDGYSRFGPQEKWGFFPSVSAGWNIAEEAFMADTPVSQLKLRGSWGLTGNNNALDRYEWQSTITTGYRYNFDGRAVEGASVTALANPALRWERTQSFNVGIDLGVLDQALTFTTNYYQSTTDDILLSIPLPGSFGFPEPTRANTGEVKSSGFEFMAGYESRNQGDFNWSVDANFSTANNEVVSLGLGNPITGANWQGGSLANRVIESQPLWHYFGWRVDRLFQQEDFDAQGNLQEGIPTQPNAAPGDIKFQDTDGNGTIDPADRVDLGSPHPRYYGGLTGQVTWKNVDLSLSLHGAGGHQILQAYAYWTQGMTRPFNAETEVTDRWTPNNTDTDVPRAISGDPNSNARMSDRFLEDGDYLRLQRLTLGYELPLGRLGLSQMRRIRVYAQAKNLWTLTGYSGYDPEVASGGEDSNFAIDNGEYVQPRTFLLGVQMNF